MSELRSLVLSAVLCAAAGPALAASVVVGVPDWPSARVTANIIQQVLGSHYDVEAKLRPIGSIEIFDAIDRGEMDVHPEVWLPNLQNFVDEYALKRGTVRLSPRGSRAGQHICVTRATQETTGINEVADLADPAVARHFDSDGDGRGEMWIGASTWSSTRIERVRAKSYGYEETMLLLTMPEELAMAQLDAAEAIGSPMVFYCYSPHYMFELHEVVPLDEPDHDPATWAILSPEEDPAWLDKSKAGSAWEPSHYHIAFGADLSRNQPEVAAFLERAVLPPDDAQKATYAIDVEKRDPAEIAAEWIAANQAKIAEWTQ